MGKVQDYMEKLHSLTDWDDYLMRESGLPGPRGNLELMYAVAETASEKQLLHFISFTAEKAPVNSPEEFLMACGGIGLGRLIAEGRMEYMKLLRALASDTRWRTREAVAMALQLFGEGHMTELIDEMALWAFGNSYEKRAAAAALCEPKLLKDKVQVSKVLGILDVITKSILEIENRKDEAFVALRKGMAYCWSVAIVYNFDEGSKLFEKWIDCPDKDIRWIVKENLKKDRLKRVNEAWVGECLKKVG
ncbi:MAG: hypothetical protein ACM3ZR_10865 [Pseudomonadota bacterium]